MEVHLPDMERRKFDFSGTGGIRRGIACERVLPSEAQGIYSWNIPATDRLFQYHFHSSFRLGNWTVWIYLPERLTQPSSGRSVMKRFMICLSGFILAYCIHRRFFHKPAAQKEAEQTVYVMKTGSKYHSAGCRHLQKSRIPMSLEYAATRYGPCSVCRPPLP